MLKAKDLRNEPREELEAMARDISRELFDIRCELKVNRKIEKSHMLKEKKRDLARILTIVTEKERQA